MKQTYFIFLCLLLSLSSLKAQVPQLLKDINPGAGVGAPFEFTEYNGLVYFRANDGTNGIELWKTDGTEAGTVLVQDINAGAGNSLPTGLTVFDGKLFLRANNGTSGTELFVFDGTDLTLLKDINLGTANAAPSNLTPFDGLLYFSANDGVSGVELWKTDGTTAGTSLISDLNPSGNSSPNNFIVFQDKLYFQATNGTLGRELFVFDGTDIGLVADINLGTGNSSPSEMIVYNDKLYFEADNGTSRQLWVYDGTNPPSEISINPEGNATPTNLAVFKGRLYFSAIRSGTASSPRSLFYYEDSDPGIIVQVLGGDVATNPLRMTVVDDLLFFSADDGINGSELWAFDGGANTPYLVKDINPSIGSVPSNFMAIRGKLYFTANEGTGTGAASRSELWTSDGTESGTQRTSPEKINNDANAVVNNLLYSEALSTLFFSATPPNLGNELWSFVIAPELSIFQNVVPIANNTTFNFANTDVLGENEVVFRLQNTGNALLNISSITVTGDGFELVGDAPSLISPSEEESIVLRFATEDVGSQTGSLNIASSDPATPDFTVNLSGLITSLNNALVQSIKVYPNPSTEELQIDLSALANQEVGLRIVDSQGREVYRQNLQNQGSISRFSIQGLKAGVYHLELTANQVRSIHRIVKQ